MHLDDLRPALGVLEVWTGYVLPSSVGAAVIKRLGKVVVCGGMRLGRQITKARE